MLFISPSDCAIRSDAPLTNSPSSMQPESSPSMSRKIFSTCCCRALASVSAASSKALISATSIGLGLGVGVGVGVGSVVRIRVRVRVVARGIGS